MYKFLYEMHIQRLNWDLDFQISRLSRSGLQNSACVKCQNKFVFQKIMIPKLRKVRFLLSAFSFFFLLHLLVNTLERSSGRISRPRGNFWKFYFSLKKVYFINYNVMQNDKKSKITDRFFFLRTVKTGSSTLLSLFYRMALRHEMNILFLEGKRH